MARHKLRSGKSKGTAFPMNSKPAQCGFCGLASTKAQTESVEFQNGVNPVRRCRKGVGCQSPKKESP